MRFMVKAKDLWFPNVKAKAKAKDTVSLRTFKGCLLTQLFITYYTILHRPKITFYNSLSLNFEIPRPRTAKPKAKA